MATDSADGKTWQFEADVDTDHIRPEVEPVLEGHEYEAKTESLFFAYQRPLQEIVSTDNWATLQQDTGIRQAGRTPRIDKPWMQYHKFYRIETAEQLEALIDKALDCGVCALDLETEGLDNRVYYDAQGRTSTVHKIVGYCLSVDKGQNGYYVPVGHTPRDGGRPCNVDDKERAERAITELCIMSQPVFKRDAVDPLVGLSTDWVKPPAVVISFWHAPFDQEFLFPITGLAHWHPDSFEDGNLAYYVWFSGDKALGLKAKSFQKLKTPAGDPYEQIEFKELFANNTKVSQQPAFGDLAPEDPSVVKYACGDAICTLLHSINPDGPLTAFAQDSLKPTPVQGRRNYERTYRLEKMVSQVKREMERARVHTDQAKVAELKNKAEADRKMWHDKICDLAAAKNFLGFNPGSPKMLGDFLFSPLYLDITPKPPMTKGEGSTQYETGAQILETMVKERPSEGGESVLEWVLKYREADKVVGTYLKSMASNTDQFGDLRFSYKQTGAATGRFSAPSGDGAQGYSGVPVHGIPAEADMRQCFIARDGYLIGKWDYAGQELRLCTNLCKEPKWLNEFRTGTGDLHTITAQAFFNKEKIEPSERKMAKIANFALIYGGGPASIVRACKCTREEAKRRKKNFDAAVPVFAKWVKSQHAMVKKELGVYDLFWRWIPIPDANIEPGQVPFGSQQDKPLDEEGAKAWRAACERHATNYPTQGSGATIMKLVMVRLHRAFALKGWLRHGGDDSIRMLLTVHDELVFEIRFDRLWDVMDLITDLMESPGAGWAVPLVTEPLLGLSWGAKIKARPLRTLRRHGAEPLQPKERLYKGTWLIDNPADWFIEKYGPGEDPAEIVAHLHDNETPPAPPPPPPIPPVPPASPTPGTSKDLETATASPVSNPTPEAPGLLEAEIAALVAEDDTIQLSNVKSTRRGGRAPTPPPNVDRLTTAVAPTAPTTAYLPPAEPAQMVKAELKQVLPDGTMQTIPVHYDATRQQVATVYMITIRHRYGHGLSLESARRVRAVYAEYGGGPDLLEICLSDVDRTILISRHEGYYVHFLEFFNALQQEPDLIVSHTSRCKAQLGRLQRGYGARSSGGMQNGCNVVAGHDAVLLQLP